MTQFKRSQAKYVKKPYKTTNWAEYDRGLVNRGSLTVWVSEDAIVTWAAKPTGKRGGQRKYSNIAIETALMVRMVFHLPWRQTKGFLRSLSKLLKSDIDIAHHTTFSRRARKLGPVPFNKPTSNRPIHILIDSTGLTVHNGNKRKPTKKRGWRKFHIAVDEKTGDVVASELGSCKTPDASRVPSLLKQIERPIQSARADSAYDVRSVYEAVENHSKDHSPRVLIPPKKNAKVDPKSNSLKERNRNIRSQKKQGKRSWHTKSGYSKRSKVETTFYRYKSIIGPMIRARTLQGQRVETRIGCKILNIMTKQGMPKSYCAE